MARANLAIDPGLTDLFVKSQDGSLRYIQAKIQGETISQAATGGRSGSAESDFGTVVSSLIKPDEAMFLMFALDPESADGHIKWVLVTYIPDRCAVRHKMLYSSSRDDFKRALGLAFFAGELNANAQEEVTFAAVQQAVSKHPLEDAPLTRLEKLAIEEKGLEKDTSIRSTAMGVVPFKLLPEVTSALSSLPGGATNWVELQLDLQKESVGLVGARTVTLAPDALPPLIPEAEARFFVVKGSSSGGGGLSLVYSCPDSAPIRQKMTYSTAKATVVAAINSLGLTLDKVTEIRQPSDIISALGLDASGEEGADGDDGGKEGELKHGLAHAKPSRPGRGRARLIRKPGDPLG